MKIILSSNSPRRKELLAGLGIDFEVRLMKGVDESYPADTPLQDVALYIATEKASAYEVADDELVITADTVVLVGDEILGKPKSRADAYDMLRKISGKTHQVITGVCLTTQKQQRRFSVKTDVEFKELSDNEINHYIDVFHPFDKAGAYGIQEWIGYIGVLSLKGSYYNVMGLPVQRIYEELTTYFGHDLCHCKSWDKK